MISIKNKNITQWKCSPEMQNCCKFRLKTYKHEIVLWNLETKKYEQNEETAIAEQNSSNTKIIATKPQPLKTRDRSYGYHCCQDHQPTKAIEFKPKTAQH